MDAIIKKLRLKFTLSTALLAGIILFVLAVGFCVSLYVSTEITAANTLDEVLDNPSTKVTDDVGRKCFAFICGDDAMASVPDVYMDEVTSYGPNLAGKILYSARAEGDGKFTVGNNYFRVESRAIGDGKILYAVLDRTADHNTLAWAAMLMTLIYITALIVVVLFFYIFSSRTLAPVSESFKKQRDLIANASHELKTPLTVISTNLSVMKSEPQSTVEENAKWVEAIDAQIQRMNGLIVNMLQLSRMENTELVKTDLDFSEIVEGACLSFDAVCFEKGVTLIAEIAPDIHVSGDKDSLDRLVSCLLDNATKYCGENGKIGLKLTADKKVRLHIMNTGTVISDEDAKHVFDRFYRTDGARSNPDNNSFGLGLSIAQATAYAHGGEITCRGVENKGTVFTVTLPLHRNNSRRDREKEKNSDGAN